MAPKIYISYRRSDGEAWADRLYERLQSHFSRENILVDVDASIPVGQSWTDWIDRTISDVSIVLVLIGRTWAGELSARINDRDYVRSEIEFALRSGVPIVPVLLGDAQMPTPSDLPESVRPLTTIQAARIHRQTFNDDTAQLIFGIERSIKRSADSVFTAIDKEPQRISRTVAFYSYARSDNRACEGLLSYIRSALETTLSVELGSPVSIFQDLEGIRTGQDWQEKLSRALEQADYLIVLYSPSFFHSDPCRRELSYFLRKALRSKRRNIIFPILWRKVRTFDDPAAISADPLLRFAKLTQYTDWTTHRTKITIDDDIRIGINHLAEEIANAIHEDATSGEGSSRFYTDPSTFPLQEEQVETVDALLRRQAKLR